MKRNEAEMRIAYQIESTNPKEVDFDKESQDHRLSRWLALPL